MDVGVSLPPATFKEKGRILITVKLVLVALLLGRNPLSAHKSPIVVGHRFNISELVEAEASQL